MLKTITLLLILLFPITATAEDWSDTDSALEISWQIIHSIDWLQTISAMKQPDIYHDNNPVMGKHPSLDKVDSYMAISAIGHLAISYLLPKEYRPYWHYLTIAISGTCVINNINVGVNINF